MTHGNIDLNCDLGERDDLAHVDARLLRIVTSANIACGGHAGDEHSMKRTVAECIRHGVAIGAHPSYPDIPGFGRHELPMTPDEIARSVGEQITRLAGIAGASGGTISHIKPHGALYHAAMRREEVATAIGIAAVRALPGAGLVGLAGSAILQLWERMGIRTISEAFADRAYEQDGSLRSRAREGSLITDPALAAAQAVRIASGRGIELAGGGHLKVNAMTICMHSDTPGATEIAAAVRAALVGAGISIEAPVL